MDQFTDTLDIGSATLEEIERKAAEKNDDSIEVIDTSPGFEQSRRQVRARHAKLRMLTQRKRERTLGEEKTVTKSKSDTSSMRLQGEFNIEVLLGGIDEKYLESQFTCSIHNKNVEEQKNPELEGLSQLLDTTFDFNNKAPVIPASSVVVTNRNNNKENVQPNHSEIVAKELQGINLSDFLCTGLEPFNQEDEKIVDSEAVSFKQEIDIKEMQDAKIDLLGKKDPENFSESIFSDDFFPDVQNNSSVIAEGTLEWRDDSIRTTQNCTIPPEVPKDSSIVMKTQSSLFSNSHGRSTSLKVDTRQNLKLMTSWGLPKNVLAEYHKKGITEMFDWQCECLSNTKVRMSPMALSIF